MWPKILAAAAVYWLFFRDTPDPCPCGAGAIPGDRYYKTEDGRCCPENFDGECFTPPCRTEG
jgi:hypothetical protein